MRCPPLVPTTSSIRARISSASRGSSSRGNARTSADDLRALLTDYESDRGRPHGALLFSCLGRGLHLYGKPDHDSGLFRYCLGDVPLGGFFCNGEIGPVHGTTFLHGYTSAFGLFGPRHDRR